MYEKSNSQKRRVANHIDATQENQLSQEARFPAPSLQFKSDDTAQLQGMEEEEELQMKSKTSQLQGMEEEEELQMKSKTAQLQGMEEEEELQMKSKTAQLQSAQNTNSGSGNMPTNIQESASTTFGADFSDVKIHANSNKATELNALAYTQGNDIHFAPGQYSPDSASGRELIGHELTHVVQQRKGIVSPTTSMDGQPINDDPGFEREADNMGRKFKDTK
ncbi:MAG: DUF4157 domain-containing protein [Bacteroidota bacterium]